MEILNAKYMGLVSDITVGHVVDIGDCVLLTGSSGSLGIHLLEKMVKSTDIKCIYALSTPTRKPVFEKHRLAALRAGLDERILGSEKVLLLSADLTLSNFGLDDHQLAKVEYNRDLLSVSKVLILAFI